MVQITPYDLSTSWEYERNFSIRKKLNRRLIFKKDKEEKIYGSTKF
jgi:hypothetical protein